MNKNLKSFNQNWKFCGENNEYNKNVNGKE